MASRFWVLGTGNWDATTTTNWAATTGGAGGASVPVAADTVTFDTNSGTAATVTITANVSVTSITINKSDLTLTTNGTATITTSGNMTLTTGTLNTNGSTGNWAALSSSTTTARTLTLGASLITLTGGGTSFAANNNTSFTLNAGSSTITLSGAGAILNCGNSGGFGVKTFNNVVFSGSGAAVLTGVTGTIYNNLTRTGTAVTTDSFSIQNNQTINGTLTLTGNSVTNRLQTLSATVGTAKTLTAAAAAFTNVDFQDITMSNSTSPGTNFTGTSLGDCQGNSGITFDTPVTQTRTGAAGTWSTAANWTSRVPLPQDSVIVSSGASGSISVDMPRLGAGIDFTGFTGTASLANAVTSFGDITLATGMTISGGQAWTVGGRGSQTITCATKTFPGGVTINASGGTYTFQDTFKCTNNLQHNNGTLTDNGQTCSASGFVSNSGLTRTANLTGVWNLSSTSAPLTVAAAGLTLNATSSTLNITDTSVNNKTFAGGGQSFGNVGISGGGTGSVTFTGANTFTNLPQITGGTKSIVWPGSTTTTFTHGGNFGNSANVITMTASAGSATLSFGTQVNADHLNLTNIIAATTTPAYAGANSTDGGGNTNWVFTAAPVSGSSSSMLLMGVG